MQLKSIRVLGALLGASTLVTAYAVCYHGEQQYCAFQGSTFSIIIDCGMAGTQTRSAVVTDGPGVLVNDMAAVSSGLDPKFTRTGQTCNGNYEYPDCSNQNTPAFGWVASYNRVTSTACQ
jgi:hypothetical protein